MKEEGVGEPELSLKGLEALMDSSYCPSALSCSTEEKRMGMLLCKTCPYPVVVC